MTDSVQHPSAPDRSDLARTLLLVALAAVALGLSLQLAVVAVRWGWLSAPPGARTAADIASGVTWSALVCSGVAAGSAINRYRASVMGVFGLVAAPVAFAVAKGVQKGVGQLTGAEPVPITSVAFQIGGLKALEYAGLGIALAWLARRRGAGLGRHAGVGLTFGLVFGTAMIAVEMAHPPMAATRLAALMINEFLFPIGCASILFAASRLAARG